MHRADLVVLVAYFLTMISVGMVYARQMKSLDLYFAGGKRLPWWLGGVSFVMSYVSALSIVVYAGLGYRYGLVALSIYWTTVPATLLITWALARRWRRAGIITPVQFLETRFSPMLRQVFAWSGIPLKVIDEGLKIVAIGIFVSVGLRISPVTAMVGIGTVTLIYTLLGGLWAVVITDFVQFILVTTAVLILLPLALQAAGGWHKAVAAIPVELFHPVNGPYTWGYLGAFLVLSILSLAGNWSLIQKFYSVRSDTECRRVGWLAAILFLALPPVWILTGMIARVFITPEGTDPQTIYARLAATLLPHGMLGLVIAALFAATMSVLSSGYNVVAAVLTVDVYQRWIHPRATERQLVVIGRVLTGGIAALALLIAIVVTHFHLTIFDTMVAAFGFFLPPTVLPMLGGLLSRRLSAGGALAGFVAGIAIGLTSLLYKWVAKPPNVSSFQAVSIVVPALVTALTLLAAAYAFPAIGQDADRVSRFFERLSQPAIAEGNPGASPGPVAGFVILVMGVILVVVGSGGFTTSSNALTLATGILFGLIGAGMVLLVSRQNRVRL